MRLDDENAYIISDDDVFCSSIYLSEPAQENKTTSFFTGAETISYLAPDRSIETKPN